MTSDLLLAIDVGTQSVRALAFDRGGGLAGRQRVTLEPAFTAPQPGWAEQDAGVYWRAVGEACRGLWAGLDPKRIAALALTTQRASVVCADAAGTPLRPVIVWPDQRLCSEPPPLGPMWNTLFAAAGARELLRQLQRQAEANWIAQHESELWRHTERFVLLSGWLGHRLVGDWVDCTAAQVGYLPFDYRHARWARAGDWRWKALAIRPSQLPRLVAPGQPLGALSAAAAAELGLPQGLPVIAAAADKACEVLGSGAHGRDCVHLSFGTAASVNSTQARYVEVQRLLPSYPAALPGAFNTEVHIQRGFWLVRWFREQFGQAETARAAALGVEPESLFEALLDETPPGAQGLTLLPHWSPGLRDPGPEGKGAIVGFGDVHTRSHLYRAIVEGLVHQLRAGRELTEARIKRKLTRLVVSGGGSQSDGTMQIAADIFGLPAERPRLADASALGAAMLAATGLGWHADAATAARKMAGPTERFDPCPENMILYDRLHREVFVPLYPRLTPLNRRLRAITGYPG